MIRFVNWYFMLLIPAVVYLFKKEIGFEFFKR